MPFKKGHHLGFQPGQSGNPGGRGSPRAEFWRQFRQAIAELQIALKDAQGKPIKKLPCVEALTRKLVKWAMEEVKFKGEETGSPQNPGMVKLFFDKALGNEVVLSAELSSSGALLPQVVDVAKLLEGLDVSEEAMAKLRKKAIAMAFPDRGLDDWNEEDADD